MQHRFEKKMRHLRNPKLVIVISILFLIFSCSKNEIYKETVNSQFEYSIFKAFESEQNKSLSNFDLEKVSGWQNLTQSLNEKYNTSLDIPDELFEIYITEETSQIPSSFKAKGWVTQLDLVHTEQLAKEIHSIGFSDAIKNFENSTVNSNLSQKEFQNRNLLANVLHIANDEKPSLLNPPTAIGTNSWGCF